MVGERGKFLKRGKKILIDRQCRASALGRRHHSQLYIAGYVSGDVEARYVGPTFGVALNAALVVKRAADCGEKR
jgi:hypothetical protein